MEPHEPAAGGPKAWDSRMDQLGDRYPEAVVSWVAPDGFPLSVRLPVSADRDARLVRLGAEPAGMPITSGLACVTAHRHGPNFEWQQNFQVRGDLVRGGAGWALRPTQARRRPRGPRVATGDAAGQLPQVASLHQEGSRRDAQAARAPRLAHQSSGFFAKKKNQTITATRAKASEPISSGSSGPRGIRRGSSPSASHSSSQPSPSSVARILR